MTEKNAEAPHDNTTTSSAATNIPAFSYTVTYVFGITIQFYLVAAPVLLGVSLLWPKCLSVCRGISTIAFLVLWIYMFGTEARNMEHPKQQSLFRRRKPSKNLLANFNYPLLKKWQKILLWTIEALLIVSYVIFFVLTFLYSGGPGIFNGRYVITSHGEIMREITAREYLFLSTYEKCIAALFAYPIILPAYFGIKSDLLTLKKTTDT